VIEALPVVDHSAMNYEPFRKDFYTPVPEIASMYNSEVMLLREELEVSYRAYIICGIAFYTMYTCTRFVAAQSVLQLV
jgi:hypothetical protein